MAWNYQPLSDYRISSGFGRRASPGGIGSTNHMGIDLAAPTGTQVYSPTDMTVIFAGQQKGYGNLVVGQTLSGEQIYFGHLDSIGVREGDFLIPGLGLGTVGSTGNSTGSHLHLGVKDTLGKWIDPKALLDTALSKGKDALKAGKKAGEKALVAGANAVLPGSGEALQAVGIGEDCGLWCQFKKWLKETDIGTRIALVIMGFVIIGGGFLALASSNINIISQAKNALAKGK